MGPAVKHTQCKPGRLDARSPGSKCSSGSADHCNQQSDPLALGCQNQASYAGFLKIAGIVALVTIVASMVFGFSLGLWFTGAMILLVGGCILYQTSNVIHHYHTSQYVAASLALFASIATLFWYVLQMFMSSRD